MRVLSDQEDDAVWKKFRRRFRFDYRNGAIPFYISAPHKVYSLQSYWGNDEEVAVNQMLIRLSLGEIYALDWRHDSFLFSPTECIPLHTWWYDDERDCNVYFPSYYPDGDFHFFVAKDFSFGFFGHPWREELWVVGDRLIQEFDRNQKLLNLKPKRTR